MSTRNARRVDRRLHRLPTPPAQDPEGQVLLKQLGHCIDTSPAPVEIKLAAASMLLAHTVMSVAVPGSELAVIQQAFGQALKLVQDRVAPQPAAGATAPTSADG